MLYLFLFLDGKKYNPASKENIWNKNAHLKHQNRSSVFLHAAVVSLEAAGLNDTDYTCNSNALFMKLVIEHLQTACHFPLHSIRDPYATFAVLILRHARHAQKDIWRHYSFQMNFAQYYAVLPIALWLGDTLTNNL